MIILSTILIYFAALLLLSRFTVRNVSNQTFYNANRQSPWYLVAFGMIGASISGVTFVSVPGMVMNQNMSYLQTCMGFIVGYALVAFVLLPIYYRLRLITIYTYLKERLGRMSYKTGASFFLLSKMAGSAVKFYVVCMILQRFVLDGYHIPFFVTVPSLVLLIWLYTRKGGIKTLVFTDTFQTLCILAALVLIAFKVMDALQLNLSSVLSFVSSDTHSQIFVWDDWISTQNFWKQFLSGVFIVIVMTGLDQDMMQKNLTCKTLRDAQKDMCTYGIAFLPVNMLFLALGILLMHYLQQMGQTLPTMPDELMLLPVAGGMLGNGVVVLFTIGVVAACFSSADSALTSLTTSYCIDICEKPNDERLRKRVHLGMAVVFVGFILGFRALNSTNLINAIYTIVSYTYGPLLGLFAYGLFTRQPVTDRLVPYIALASPLLCYGLDMLAQHLWQYKFGYELLMLNGAITFIGLWITTIIKPKKS
ncbi:sodium:solute symporter [Prevotella ihumii]|uniref:sodium:solute symporter n=1 Tax=Prevotella ihumii TaxID=1917878 RepID=UPI000980D620|nr:sodium:solute symporter [Prevotella ihumii]